MKVLFIILLIPIALYLLGLILPKYRTAKTTIKVKQPPNVVWKAVTNNNRCDWRSDISKIDITNNTSWIEYPNNGVPIIFTMKSKIENEYYLVDMKNKMFTGYFELKFSSNTGKDTEVDFIEKIALKYKILKPASYLFFNIQKFQNMYVEDLKKHIDNL
ncbi:hypothetical protein PV797_02285 [Clostridiaceae bacterium M8S5]|nr:hypothetical protein PV797_02285 [Clostridiaceae bacterium M8S5]